MGNYLNIGNAGFQTVRKGLYIDKSGMISFINSTLGTMDKMTCVSRPRRFGKSFAAKMLCAYYDKSCDSRELFADLEISDDPSFEKHLNQYDVIYLDITLFISSVQNVREVVPSLQSKVIAEIREAFPSAKREVTLIETLASVTEATGSKFIIIIDEWDALFREANNSEVQQDYIQLLRSLFKSSLTDKAIEAAYMTGILPIKKYGTQSAMTDFREYTMLQPGPLQKYVGFTEAEVKSLCKRYDMDFAEAKRWYDGYSFSRIKSVYSPNSIIMAMKLGEYNTYWTQTETYESLKVYIEMDEDGLKETIVQMLGGAASRINIRTFQNDMTTIKSKDDVLTLLVHLGYLTYQAKDKTVSIPNEEVRQEFIGAVENGKHKAIAKLVSESDQLLQYTLNMNEEAVAAAIAAAHSAGTAPIFYNNEQALRSVIRFAYLSCVDEYQEIQELPSGIGYADVVYIPKKGSALPPMIIELKWNKTADGAIRQIRERNYPQVLEGIFDNILLVGINYDESTKVHTCKIEKYRKK